MAPPHELVVTIGKNICTLNRGRRKESRVVVVIGDSNAVAKVDKVRVLASNLYLWIAERIDQLPSAGSVSCRRAPGELRELPPESLHQSAWRRRPPSAASDSRSRARSTPRAVPHRTSGSASNPPVPHRRSYWSSVDRPHSPCFPPPGACRRAVDRAHGHRPRLVESGGRVRGPVAPSVIDREACAKGFVRTTPTTKGRWSAWDAPASPASNWHRTPVITT